MILPDRAQVTMAVPFMRAYQQLLVRTCHARGAHAIGGMSAFIPNRREPEVTDERPLARVRTTRSARRATASTAPGSRTPDLVPTVAATVFDGVLGDRPNQKDRLREEGGPPGADARWTAGSLGPVTEAGLRTNVSVALQYLASWLGGNGAAGHQQPDGGRGDRRDQPQPALAMAHPRRPARRWQADDGRALSQTIRDAELGALPLPRA